MTNPTLTYGDGHLEDFVDLWDWTYESEATGDGAVGKTTTIDAIRTEADDTWNGYYIKFLSGDNAGEARRITDFDQGTTTFTHAAFSNQTLEGDRYVISKFVSTLSNVMGTQCNPQLNPEDVLDFEITFDDVHTEEYGYLEFALPASLDSDIYTKCLVRHKSGDAQQKCRVVLVFSAGTQTIVDDDNTTTWKVTSATVTTAKTITGFRVYCLNPNTDATPDAYSAYYDFVKICKNVFTFPHVSIGGKSGGIYPEFKARLAKINIPGRGGDVIQNLGFHSPIISLRGDVLQGESWGTPVGQYILEIIRNDEWSWFTSDRINCKVMVESFLPAQDVGSGALCLWDLVLSLYSASDLLDDIWGGVDGWLGIE